MQNCGEQGAAERMSAQAGLSEPKWRFSAPLGVISRRVQRHCLPLLVFASFFVQVACARCTPPGRSSEPEAPWGAYSVCARARGYLLVRAGRQRPWSSCTCDLGFTPSRRPPARAWLLRPRPVARRPAAPGARGWDRLK